MGPTKGRSRKASAVQHRDIYAAESIEENWDVLLRLVALFRKVATQVGDSLGYRYPTELDDAMMEHLQYVRSLPAPGGLPI